MKNSKTLYQFIIDQSGSMQDIHGQTVALFNKQIDSVKELTWMYPEQKYFLGLTVFNNHVNHLIDFMSSEKIRYMRPEEYITSGFTALYDAIGETADRIRELYGDKIARDEMSIVVVVITDGAENCSRKYTELMVKTRIKELEQTGKWTFTMLGADFNVSRYSSSLNFKHDATRTYDKSDLPFMEEDLSASLHRYAHLKSKGIVDNTFLRESSRTEENKKCI
jgi:uncharacterized protein YegL